MYVDWKEVLLDHLIDANFTPLENQQAELQDGRYHEVYQEHICVDWERYLEGTGQP